MDTTYFSLVNLSRCLRWHEQGLGSWSASDWMTALAGEVGEAANVVKKLNRIRDGLPGNKEGITEASLKAELADEIGDIYAYLDLFAQSQGLDLAACAVNKFNKVSERLGFPEQM